MHSGTEPQNHIFSIIQKAFQSNDPKDKLLLRSEDGTFQELLPEVMIAIPMDLLIELITSHHILTRESYQALLSSQDLIGENALEKQNVLPSQFTPELDLSEEDRLFGMFEYPNFISGDVEVEPISSTKMNSIPMRRLLPKIGSQEQIATRPLSLNDKETAAVVRKRHRVDSSNKETVPVKKKREFNPYAKYVYADGKQAGVEVTGLSEAELLSKFNKGTITTATAYKQRQLVWEDGSGSVGKEVLKDRDKVKQLIEEGRIITATTQRNRKLYRDKYKAEIAESESYLISLLPALPKPGTTISKSFHIMDKKQSKTLNRISRHVMNASGLSKSRFHNGFKVTIVNDYHYGKTWDRLHAQMSTTDLHSSQKIPDSQVGETPPKSDDDAAATNSISKHMLLSSVKGAGNHRNGIFYHPPKTGSSHEDEKQMKVDLSLNELILK